jgi:hypothetical protein
MTVLFKIRFLVKKKPSAIASIPLIDHLSVKKRAAIALAVDWVEQH